MVRLCDYGVACREKFTKARGQGHRSGKCFASILDARDLPTKDFEKEPLRLVGEGSMGQCTANVEDQVF